MKNLKNYLLIMAVAAMLGSCCRTETSLSPDNEPSQDSARQAYLNQKADGATFIKGLISLDRGKYGERMLFAVSQDDDYNIYFSISAYLNDQGAYTASCIPAKHVANVLSALDKEFPGTRLDLSQQQATCRIFSLQELEQQASGATKVALDKINGLLLRLEKDYACSVTKQRWRYPTL